MGQRNVGFYYAAAWAIFLLVWLAAAFSTKRAARIQSRRSRLGQGLLFAIGGVLMARPKWGAGILGARFVPRSPAIAWAGLAVTVAGIAFAIWARVHLGRNWSGRVTIKEGHELIRSGPYRYVRHPIYTGILAALAGIAVGLGEVHSIVGFAFLAAGLLSKANLEEKFMRQQFGAEYARYEDEVKRLIPFVW